MICGTAENKIENVVFSDVDVTLSKTSKWDCGLYDMRPGLNKEVEKHKNAGFYLRFADNVTLRNTSVKWGNVCPEYSAALEEESCVGTVLEISRVITPEGFENAAACSSVKFPFKRLLVRTFIRILLKNI